MRLTYIHQHFRRPDQQGGGRPYQFARRLAEDGHEVTMVCAGEERRTYRLDGFTVEQLETAYDNRMSMARRMLSFARFMVVATLAAARLRADVVLASSTPLTAVIPGIVAATLRRARLVVEIRDLWPEVPITLGFLPRPFHRPARLLERLAYARADAVIALAPGMAEGVLAVAPGTDVTVVPNAADVEDFTVAEPRADLRARFGIGEDQLCFAYAGGLGHVYDVDWLADLARHLTALGHRLLVAGDGACRDAAEDRLRAAGVDPASVFLGPLPRAEVARLAAASDAGVSTLIDEPCLEVSSLNKVFDAMAAGRPMIVNHGGWSSGLLLDAGAGLRLPRTLTRADAEEAVTWVRDHPEAGRISADLGRGDFSREHLYERFRRVVTGEGPPG